MDSALDMYSIADLKKLHRAGAIDFNTFLKHALAKSKETDHIGAR
jgi:hypothetical protein